MEAARRYTLLIMLTLFTLFKLFKLIYAAKTVACMPVYIVLKGNLERYWNGLMSNEQNIGWMEWSRVDCMGDTPQTVMTTRAPAVLTNALFKCSLV